MPIYKYLYTDNSIIYPKSINLSKFKQILISNNTEVDYF